MVIRIFTYPLSASGSIGRNGNGKKTANIPIGKSKDTEDREYKSLESITWDNYPKYLLTTDTLLQKRNGIIHTNLIEFIKNENKF